MTSDNTPGTPPVGKDLFDHLTDIETEIDKLLTITNIYQHLLSDGESPEEAYLMESMCTHTQKLHDIFRKAWPLITKN